MDQCNTSSSSSSFQQQNQIEEETTTFNPSKTKPFNSYGIPLKPGVKSVAIQKNREREKRELSDLNDHFASYIERVRFLEAHNKKLQLEIDGLREKWDLQTNKLKEKYDIEIQEARRIIDDTTKERAIIELRAKRTEEEGLKLQNKYELLLSGRDSNRQKLDLLQKQLFNNKADIDLYRRRLIDLEDEKKHYNNKSQKLILDIQRITKELDHEIITRIEFENQKQNLEEEIQFLKNSHLEEIEELKQSSTILDPTNFFKNELSNAIQNIREEYEQLNHQQRDEIHSWYQSKVTQTIQEIQSHQAIEESKNIREEEEIKKLRTLVSDSQQDILTMRQRNEELENRIRELENLIRSKRTDNIQSSDQRDRKIKDLKIRLEDLGRYYDELISTKSSLDSEISIYRKLLEGEEKRKGLKQIAENIEEQARTNSQSTNYSRSYQRTSGHQSFGNKDLMLTSYVPYQSLSSTRTEPTIFEQVYGDSRRRRPTSISLNVQWIPVVDRSSTNIWSTSNINNRKFKTVTFFDTGAMREQHQPKAVTPPSSDYTDAYLNAFAPKPFPTRRIYRINAPVFANVAPIKTNLFTNSSIKTSQTRFNNINNFQRSNLFNKIVPHFPTSSSIYSSNVIPDIFPKYEPLSSTQSSSYETQTYNSNNSTSFHNRLSSETIIPAFPQSSLSTISTTYRSESPYENVHKPAPPDSLQTYPSSSTTPLSSPSKISSYKPSVSFQSVPLTLSNNIRQSSTDEQIVLLPSNIEKQINRPETLLFQPDEDIHLSCIEKPSPIITPLLESPITHVESKTKPERTSTEELSTISSKPIEILEKTISKYDAIIDQISEVLASVSPLSSTLSSISPGKSVLDYELTADGSPILQRKHIESEPSQESTTPIKNTYTQRIKGKHLIRDDSYDKIITAIADLDSELTPPPDIQTSSTTVIEEEKEESLTPSLKGHQMLSSSEQLKDEVKSLSFDEHPTPSLCNEMKEEAEILLPDRQQLSSITEKEEREHQTNLTSPSDILTSELHRLNETKLDKEKFVDVQFTTETLSDNPEFVQQQTELLPNVPIVETTRKEISESKDEVTSNKNNGKRVTWRDIVVTNEDEESSPYQTLTEESSSLSEGPIAITEKKRLTSDASTIVVEQEINLPTSIEPSSLNDQRVISTASTKPSTNIIKRQIEFSSSSETSSSFSDSVDRETTPSDLNESRSDRDEQVISSRGSDDTRVVCALDSSNKNTSTVDERLSTISDVVNKENTDLQVEEIESNKMETPIQLVDVTGSEARTSTIRSIPLSSLPVIESPVNTLVDSISTRYISSDVYHGYLGEHAQFIESPSDVDTENMKISLLASLRQTIATPATPIIETVQSVVSMGQTLTAARPSKKETEMIDDRQNKTTLTIAMITDSNEVNNKHGTQIEENIPTVHAVEEAKTMFENIPHTITESIPIIVLNLQASKQEALSTSSTEPVSEDTKNLTILEPTPTTDNAGLSVEKLDDHSTNEIESARSSLFDSIQEKVSDAIATVTETVQNMIYADIPSIQKQTTEESTLASLPLDTLHEESKDNPINVYVALTSPVNLVTPANTPSSEVVTLSSVNDKTTESIISTPIARDDELVISTEIIRDQSSLSQAKEQVLTPPKSEFYADDKISDEEKITPATVSSQVSGNEVFQPTTHQQLFNTVSPKDDVTTTDKTDMQTVSTSLMRTELTSTFEIDEAASATDKENGIILKTVHELIDDLTQTVQSQLQQNSIKVNQEIFSSDSALTQSIIPQVDSTSVKTKIENIPSKLSFDFRESSPTNTEPDSLELIHALRGHSIASPTSPKQMFYPPEKSTSTTTSSQITSSDRYVSYAIHQMGESSQERLPSFPIVADIPIYKTIEEDVLLKPNIIDTQLITKEDDSTEFDATENLTSYSDDILLQRLHTSAINKQKKFDTSSTDDDVDDEIEQHDLTDLERIIDKLAQPSSLSLNEEAYQRYDLATTPSSNDDSSSSSRQQSDDFYFIPGYSGLWRPSAENDNTNIPIDYDADDERKTATKTRTIARTLTSTKRPLIFQYPENESENLTSDVPIRPNSIDLYKQSINEDISESDSYQTCPSSISKQEEQSKEQHQISSDENIFLIREPERGVSLPITMKIDCDDIAFRLSTSSPIDTQLYSRIQPDLSSPSTHSEPPLPIKIDSNNQASSPSENDQQKLSSSWLNTINTETTTTEESDGSLPSRISLLKSAKGPISISECHPQGNYIIIENTSRSKKIDLTNWKIQQENESGDNIIFTFPDYCLLKPNHSLKILTKTNQSEQRNDDLIASSLSSWYTGSNILTTLINSEGKDCATLTKKLILS